MRLETLTWLSESLNRINVTIHSLRQPQQIVQRVIVEGTQVIEAAETREPVLIIDVDRDARIESQDCDEIQGFLFSKPGPGRGILKAAGV